jgi:AcrR family transcriptional regulator
MSTAPTNVTLGKTIRQKRGRKTYDALIATTFELLEDREFDDISIAELATKAGYSVGAFYARFRSKDELLDAMVARHVEGRQAARDRVFASASADALVEALIKETVATYWSLRRFWRAALFRSIRDPKFWEPIRNQRYSLASSMIEWIRQRTNRELKPQEELNVRFAAQLVLGTINNSIINRPGPIFMGQELFVENLCRAFRLVSGFDELIGKRSRRKRR